MKTMRLSWFLCRSCLWVLWAAGRLLSAFDLRPSARSARRRFAAVLCGAVVAACLLPVVRIAAAEFQNRPTSHRESAVPRPLPPFAEGIRHKHEAVLNAVRSHVEHGRSPDYFWPPETEKRLRRLMEEGRFEEADQLLEEKLRILDQALHRDLPFGNAGPRFDEQSLPTYRVATTPGVWVGEFDDPGVLPFARPSRSAGLLYRRPS